VSVRQWDSVEFWYVPRGHVGSEKVEDKDKGRQLAKARYALAINTARTYGRIFDTCTYGPYVCVSRNAPIYSGQSMGSAYL